MSMSRYLTSGAAAAHVGMHPETIRQAIRENELKARRRGFQGRYRISIAELERWFNEKHKPA